MSEKPQSSFVSAPVCPRFFKPGRQPTDLEMSVCHDIDNALSFFVEINKPMEALESLLDATKTLERIIQDRQEQKKSSQWQRVPESLLDLENLEDGAYYMYGKLKNKYHSGPEWQHYDNGYEIIYAVKFGRKFNQISVVLSTGISPDLGGLSITPEYYMKAEEWPKPPEKAGKDEKTG